MRPGRGRLLDELLVTPLRGAVALPEGDDVPVRVTQELDLDVPAAFHEPLEVDGSVAEGLLGLARRRGDRGWQVGRGIDAAHAPAAAAGGRLDEQRIADLRGRPLELVGWARRVRGRAARAVPGTMGTPARRAERRAASLSPSAASVPGAGPTKTSPAASTAAPKAACSERKP